jgi:outer membrane receptor protein involved in Fe transport
MKHSLLAVTMTSAFFIADATAETNSTELPSMIVSADFRPSQNYDAAVSISSIDDGVIRDRGAQHIEDILNLTPNVNISSGASRGQYFQIRGIGERSEFKAPLNPSVGLFIDGIDFSRTGGAATLFDIQRVEILRGPQGTQYGANGMAGTINLFSTQPSNEFDIKFQSTLADYNTRTVGVAVGGPLAKDKLLGRFSVHSHQSDGYMENAFLGKDNTQNRDEITARGHLKWLVSTALTVDLNIFHLNTDNGYDAFTLDNSRTTQSDQPGEDSQHTNAFSLKTDYRASDKVQLQSNLTYSKSDLVYSYDDDWSHKTQFPSSSYPYSGFDEYMRERENYSAELRALSNENGRIFSDTTDWTVGLFIAKQRQDLDRKYFSNEVTSSAVDIFRTTNTYETYNSALYGQLDTAITEKLTLITGLRAEYWEADYKDSDGLTDSPNEMMYGGKIGLKYQINTDHMAYGSVSKGYKAGGINVDPKLDEKYRSFDTEQLWNIEAGLKSFWLDRQLKTAITAFYMLRRDAQVKSSLQYPKDDGSPGFVDYLENAAQGRNMGIELEADWLITEKFRALASVGLLKAVYDDYDNPELQSQGIKMKGRRQAHAPAYQFSLGGEYYITQDWTLRTNIEGKDEFYYSNSHNEKSSAFSIVNASLEYVKNNWTISMWGRNLFDKDYYTRGFFFGIDPSVGYDDRKYVQYGDPRVVGMTLTYDY